MLVSMYGLSHVFSKPYEYFLILAHDLVPASEFLWVWHSFSCHTDYTQVFKTYRSSFFQMMEDHCVAGVVFWDT